MTNKTFLKTVVVAGIVLIGSGAMIGALRIAISHHSFAYMLIGCGLFSYVAYMRNDMETLWICFFFTLVNIVGVLNWILN